MSRQVHFIGVGACAIDTILSVPYFPAQDSKLRATALSKRRGGNCPNTLEVLKQLIQYESARLKFQEASIPPQENAETGLIPKLNLIATFPSKTSMNTEFMKSSFHLEPLHIQIKMEDGSEKIMVITDPLLDFSHCVFREEHSEPVSSYIISDASTSSRTIVNYNALAEMTSAECIERFDNIVASAADADGSIAGGKGHEFWFHFEGRIPDVALEGMRHLRKLFRDNANMALRISVELEKPGREGLQELVEEADLIFYSRGWAEHQGYESATNCVRRQSQMFNNIVRSTPANDTDNPDPNVDYSSVQSRQRTFICTWGASGACAITQGSSNVVHSPAYQDPKRQVIDTTGAGDTFIAGILFGFLWRHGRSVPPKITDHTDGTKARVDDWSLKEKLDFANELAGRKVLQSGFAELASVIQDARSKLDKR